MKPYPAAGPYSCAKQPCRRWPHSPRTCWQVGAGECRAMKKCKLASQCQPATGVSAAVMQLHQCWFWRALPELPPALLQATDMSQTAGETLVPWVHGGFGKSQSLLTSRGEITKWFVTNYSPCSKNNQLISFKKRAERFSASTWAFFPKENFIMVNISRATVVHMVNSCFNMIWHNNCLEIISLTFL